MKLIAQEIIAHHESWFHSFKDNAGAKISTMEWLSKVEDAHLELTAEIQIYLDRTGASATEDPTDQVTSHSLAKDKAELIELAENMKTLFSEFSAQLKSSGGPRLTKEDVTSSFLSRGKASLSHRNIDAIPEEDDDAFSAFGSLRQVPMRKSFASSSCLTDSNAPTASKWSMRDVSSIRRSSLDLRPVHSAENTVLYEDYESIVFAKPSVKPKSTFGTTSSRQSSFAGRSSVCYQTRNAELQATTRSLTLRLGHVRTVPRTRDDMKMQKTSQSFRVSTLILTSQVR